MERKDDVVSEVYLKTIDVSRITNLAESTIRKYSLELEKQGYEFNKDGDTRLYHTDDVTVFNTLKEIREKTKVSLNHAVSVLMTQQTRATQGVARSEVAVTRSQSEEEQYALQSISSEIRNFLEDIKTEFIGFRKELEIERQSNDVFKQELEAEREKNQQLEKKLDLIMTELEKINAKADISNQEPKRKKLFGIF
ncbi:MULTISPECIES: hypothetical protein [Bacillus cereus group]|uniref:hypothetical protein n=1 Tax=Bacillus cereus group TaxID=86661 RepID=UPI000856F3D9|nr:MULTISPECIES: hypothetical protein [Bacillus cereus group]PEC52498.1 hypothetical protein CON05_25715 [Bacillus cereus]PEK09397.1 hypothetical protein CN681_14155 [Bacillus toyonensis]PGA50831.1 hypothetical protein COL86_28810 [Bacillus toyonensis]PGB97448.1 hypothetical protein COM19_19460 [Bacillus toyonensis]PGU39793.1 hypothetical protein COD91_23330 [Bacillus cereus]